MNRIKKVAVVLLLMVFSTNYAQQTEEADKGAIIRVVEQFFESLKLQDTVLYKSTLLPEGQVWRIRNTEKPATLDMRNFAATLNSFDPAVQLEERALSYDIKIHHGLAMAWVPYEFEINGKFSHCGVDIFTCVKTNSGWKIATAAYTVDKEDCESLKK